MGLCAGGSGEEFAKSILRFYDPITFELLFGPKDLQELVPDPGPAPKLVRKKRAANSAVERDAGTLDAVVVCVNRLAAILMMRGAPKGEPSK